MADIPFTKMQGAGNDYIYLDCIRGSVPDNLSELARQMSDRRFGVGGDGLILIHPSEKADVRMQMLNADGSEAEMCGNGIRCVGKYAFDHHLCRSMTPRVETAVGILGLELELLAGRVTRVRVDMGEPVLKAEQIPCCFEMPGEVVNASLSVAGQSLQVTCVSMGNPHCVVFVDKANDADVLGLGPRIEQLPVFPRGTNVEFVEVQTRSRVQQRTWERGSGETWACGTGACAVCVAGALTNRTDRTILVQLRGGELAVRWCEATNRVYMTGPAEEVFTGTWPVRRS